MEDEGDYGKEFVENEKFEEYNSGIFYSLRHEPKKTKEDDDKSSAKQTRKKEIIERDREQKIYEEKRQKALALLKELQAPADIIARVEQMEQPAAKRIALVITSDFDIILANPLKQFNGVTILTDVDRKSSYTNNLVADHVRIQLSPLAKALYFLYLRHEEGIAFKELGNYAGELSKYTV